MATKLVLGRELNGNLIDFAKERVNFREELKKIQASKPVVTGYQGTNKVAGNVLEQMRIQVATIVGTKETDVLVSGGRRRGNTLSLFEVGVVGQIDNRVKCQPEFVWPYSKENKEAVSHDPVHLWRSPQAFLELESEVSCIKVPRKGNLALIATLGSDTYGGTLYVVTLGRPVYFPSGCPVSNRRIRSKANFSHAIWSLDMNINGTRAAIGTSMGASLYEIETMTHSWFLCCDTDVVAQQFDQSGNIVICGLRDGRIVTIDAREGRRVSSRRAIQPPRCGHMQIDPSCTTFLPSSISCLASLQSSDQYFLASSVDGLIKLYDHRFLQKGAVQSYEGHINSKSSIELGVDPSERFVMSGGEDCFFRLWNIKSGKLLLEERFSDSVLSNICWQRTSERKLDVHQSYRGSSDTDYGGYGAWLGSEGGSFHLDWSRVVW